MTDDHAGRAIFDALNRLAVAADAAITPGGLLAALADGARGLLPFTATALATGDGEGWQVWRTTAARPADVTHMAPIPAPAAETLARFVERGALLRAEDLLVPPWRDAAHRDVLWKDGTRSALLVPLNCAHPAALSFTSPHPDRYRDAHEEIARFLGWMIAGRLRETRP